jgi:hypothetical protein
MKHLRFVSNLALALLCTTRSEAGVTIINWTSVSGTVAYNGYLPRSASDWVYGTVTMFESGKEFAGIEYATGNGIFAPTPTTIQWNAVTPMNGEVGHATSVALAAADKYDAAIEVHQGGQDGGAQLWYSLGSGKLGGTLSEQIPPTIKWAASQSYDTGFNPSVAVDNSNYLSNPINTTVVEVHQAASGSSQLYYHWGLLLGINTSSPSMLWGPATKIPSVSGYAPSVTISDNLVIVAYQGSSGEMFYVLGQNGGISGITWGSPVYYTQGYNPSISVYGCSGCTGWTVLEAHQGQNSTGALWYRTGAISKQGKPVLIWTPDGDTQYDTGCYPSIAQNGVYVWETHEYSCGDVAPVLSSFGQLVYYH